MGWFLTPDPKPFLADPLQITRAQEPLMGSHSVSVWTDLSETTQSPRHCHLYPSNAAQRHTISTRTETLPLVGEANLANWCACLWSLICGVFFFSQTNKLENLCTASRFQFLSTTSSGCCLETLTLTRPGQLINHTRYLWGQDTQSGESLAKRLTHEPTTE